MMFSKTIVAGVLAGLVLSSGAFAQTAAPVAPAAAMTTPAAPMGMDKKAISKACSDEATQQGLHGKARKTYRSKCKKDKMGKM